jgi:hypothetical protein
MSKTLTYAKRALLIWFGISSVLISGCATAPDLGARSGFAGARVPAVTVAPLYTSSSFGQGRTDIDARLALAAVSAQRALETYGFEVVGPDALRETLQTRERLQDYRDGILLRYDLREHFEPDKRRREARIETRTLRELADAMPTRYVLFGQLVYHTTTTCRVDPVTHQPIASIEPDDAPLPSPCAISHVAFKLVDARTGETMWFNKAYLESRGEDGDAFARRNLSRAVAEALVGERGLPRYFEPGGASPDG